MVRRQNSLLHPDTVRVTPEFGNVLHFLKKHRDVDLDAWPSRVPFADAAGVARLPFADSAGLLSALAEGEGRPVIVTDATEGWPAQDWTLQRLRDAGGATSVLVNDRAPARHADILPGGGGPQQSIQLRLTEYIDYIEQLPASLDRVDPATATTPFYLNGWRAFSDVPTLAADCPAVPRFAAPLDETAALLAAIDAQLFGAAPGTPGSAWCTQVDDNLRKLFVSPPGALTRLHYDAGDAHGWLAQVAGRKLFVLLPPSATPLLHPLTSETETVQSPIDPLRPDGERWPEYRRARPLATVVGSGETVVIPKGWWHYALALDRSITVQKNFYHSSNAAGLVQMVMKTAASLRGPSKP